MDGRWLACALGSSAAAADAMDNRYKYSTQFAIWDTTRWENVCLQKTGVSAIPLLALVGQPPVLVMTTANEIQVRSVPGGEILEAYPGWAEHLQASGDTLFALRPNGEIVAWTYTSGK